MEDKVYIPTNTLVKVFFKNGNVIEGSVIFWNDFKGIIQSTENSSRMIIYSPIENVMMIKIIEEKNSLKNSVLDQSIDQTQIIDKPINSSFEDIVEMDENIQSFDKEENVVEKHNFASGILNNTHSPNLNERTHFERTQKLIQLKLNQTKNEKKQVASMLKSEPKKVSSYYESPNFQKR